MGKIDEAVPLDLVGRIYEAAVEPDRWPAFMEAFGRAVDASGVVLWLHDFADGSANFDGGSSSLACFTGFDPEAVASYAAHYSHVNVWAQNEDKLCSGSVVTSAMLYPDADLVRTEYYNDWLKPQGLFHALGGVVVKKETLAVKFSALRSSRRGMYSKNELALYRLLMPHLQRAVTLHRGLAHTRLSGRVAMASLDLLPTAVWLLGDRGELLHANPAARQLSQCGNVITQMSNGRPRARVASEDQRLQRLIYSALHADLSLGLDAGGTMMMWSNNGGDMLHVMVTPLVSGLDGFGSAAAVFATDPKTLPHNLEENLRRFYELTKAEARMAAALMAGESVMEFSEQCGISVATARTHLKRIMAKTDTRRQSDLIRLMVTGPAMFELSY
ncbi:MAG: helix-turn-helix transcriptional regulator [Sulfuriferula sp.]